VSFLDALRPPPPPQRPDRFTGGVVTQTGPPVMLLLDTDPTDETPVGTLLVAVTVGDRVWCQFHGTQLIVLGKVQP
jgi:hypothetical protein